MTQLHSNDFTLYWQHIKDGGHTASCILCTGLRNSSSSLTVTGAGVSESVPNHSDSEWVVVQALRAKSLWSGTNNSSSSFFVPRQQTPIADFGSHSKDHMFLNLSCTNECLLMTSLLLLISCWCGKPRPRPLCPPGGSRSLPRAGSPLTDSFLVW